MVFLQNFESNLVLCYSYIVIIFTFTYIKHVLRDTILKL